MNIKKNLYNIYLRASIKRMRTVLNQRGYVVKKQKPAIIEFCKIIGIPVPKNVSVNDHLIYLYKTGKLASIKPDVSKSRLKKSSKISGLVIVDFYETDEWKKLKKQVFKKYGCYCMKCGLKNAEIHVDHIKPRSKRPDLELNFNNMQCLCKNCNYKKSNINEIDYRPDVFKTQYPLPN